MNSKEKIAYSWRIGSKSKAYTSFVLYLKVFKTDLYLIKINCFYNINNNFLGAITSGCQRNKPPLLSRRHVRMGAFEQLFSPGRGEFEQKFSKNSNARGVARGGMLKLRFDWYITCHEPSFQR